MEADYTVVNAPHQYVPELGSTRQKSPVVRIYGVTERGNSVLMNGIRSSLPMIEVGVSSPGPFRSVRVHAVLLRSRAAGHDRRRRSRVRRNSQCDFDVAIVAFLRSLV